MKISVVICTRNRAAILRRVLASVCTQTLPSDSYEIIVVDNASSDETPSVARAFSDTQDINYIYESTPGLSHARNTGWKNARGTYVAFLDDDATAHEIWLETLCSVFDNAREPHVCVGGKVVPEFEDPRPPWLPDELLFCLGALDCADAPAVLNDTTYFLHGCNMAFRKETLEHFGGFQDQLGRKRYSLRSGEDVFLQEQIRASGGRLLYHPNAAVTHHIPTARLTRRWFLARLYFEGISTARIEHALGTAPPLRTELKELQHKVINRYFLLDPNMTKYCFTAWRLGRAMELLSLRLRR